MQELYPRRPERNRCLSVGSEDLKLGPGGIGHMARIFSCSRTTILFGIKELDEEKAPLKKLNRKLVPVESLCLKSALRSTMIYYNGIMSLYLKWIPYDIFHYLSPSRVFSPKNPLVFRQQRVPG